MYERKHFNGHFFSKKHAKTKKKSGPTGKKPANE
jgi:hypothetical protein